MDAVFRQTLVVPEEAVDANGHVNNVVYLDWVQDVAKRHSEVSGCSRATREAGATWVVRKHRIVYLKPAFAGDEIEVRTWVATMERARSLRRTEIARTKDGQILARAWTDWVFVRRESGKPALIPPEVASVFELVPEETSRNRSGTS